MTAAEMDIIIGAEVHGAVNGLKQVNTQLVKTEQTATKVSKKVGTDFTNLGRVIQDLPFGFIGIQNNLTQLMPAAGGLGLAISAVTAAITFAQVGFSNWTRGFASSKEEIDEFTKGLRSAEQGALATGVKLQGYINIVRDQKLPLEDRNNALREANEILGKHGEKLTLASAATNEATEAINKHINALINEALAAKNADKIADLIIKQSDASKAYGKSVEALNKAQEDARGSVNPLASAKAIKAYYDSVKAASDYKAVTQELHTSFADFQKLLLQGLHAPPLPPPPKPPPEVQTRVNAFIKGRSKFDDEIAIETGDNIHSKIQKTLDAQPALKVTNKPLEIPPTALEKLTTDLNTAIEAGVENMAIALGETIGKVITGAKNPFAALFEMFGQTMKLLGEQLIRYGVVMEVLNKLKFSGIAAIAAGIALVALGSSMQNLVPKFATGGIVTKKTLALVGENGPEKITPLGYEGRANTVMNGEVIFTIQGNTLRGVLNRANNNAYNTF